MRRRAGRAIACLAAAWLLPAGVWARPTASRSAPAIARSHASLDDVAHQVHNPVGPLWQLTLDHSILGLRGGGLGGVEPAYTGSFEPQGPIWEGGTGSGGWDEAGELAFFARLTVPFVSSVPLPPGSAGDSRRSGIGDIQLGGMLAPRRLSGWVFGLGPTFIFPSASADALGQGKWQAGPAAVAGYLGRKWIASVLVQQWWSFAGADGRSDTNQLDVSYTLLRDLPRRWQIGMQPSLDVDWKASRGDAVTFPIGLGVGKTVRIAGAPVQLWLEADYYAVHPDDQPGPRWGLDLQIVPVIPRSF